MSEDMKKKQKNTNKSWNRYGSDKNTSTTAKFLMDFVSTCKTERECVRWFESDLSKRGAKKVQDCKNLKPGDIIYINWKGRAFLAARIGKKDLTSGTTIIASHIDSPRIDVKSRPLYEDSNLAFFDCHYYGGLKKYQWTNVPLALHGEIYKPDGSVQTISTGEKLDEPILMIPDLEPHIDRDISRRKASEAVTGENLDAIAGHRPDNSKKESVKEAIKEQIKRNWGIEEEDFLSCDLSLVPAGPARFSGLDRSLIASYGLDDRICASLSYKAFVDMEIPERTALFVAVDREEIGSEGIGGAQSSFLDLFLLELLQLESSSANILSLRKCYSASGAISADVTSGANPIYKAKYERDQQPLMGNGIGIVKFSGHGGKYDGSEARGEFIAQIVSILKRSDIPWQTGSFGKVDKAGGGTIAKYLARNGIDTVDMGPALLSMHSPVELASVADTEAVYRTYKEIWQHLEKVD